MPRTSPAEIVLSQAERAELEALARRYTAPYQTVVRAKIILLAHAGYNNSEIAARLDLPRQIVSRWRHRYYTQRAAGLVEQARSGRPSTFSPAACRTHQSARLRIANPTRLALGALFHP